MDFDLSSLDRGELERLKKGVDKALLDYDARQRTEAHKKLQAYAKEMGFSLSELTGNSKPGKGTPPRYVHPENPKLTWSGRGRRPNWIVKELEAGKALEDFEIG